MRGERSPLFCVLVFLCVVLDTTSRSHVCMLSSRLLFGERRLTGRELNGLSVARRPGDAAAGRHRVVRSPPMLRTNGGKAAGPEGARARTGGSRAYAHRCMFSSAHL